MLQTHFLLLLRTSRLGILLVIFVAWFNSSAYAQEEQEVKDIIESLAPGLPEDYDLSELLESLTYLQKHPIDLNHTTSEELKTLVFLSPLQISNYFQHLKTNGKLLDLLELQSIEGFDIIAVKSLMPFVRLTGNENYKDISVNKLVQQSEQELLFRFGQTLEKQKGFQDLPGSRYLGSPERLLGKYKYHYKDLVSVSLIVEKDAGEYLFSGTQKTSFDFMSGNVSFYKSGIMKKLVIGDYSLQFGQGLTLWSGFGFGKGPDVTSVAKKDLGLKPYSSSNENSYLRGVAATLTLQEHIDLTTFVSTTTQDASTKLNEDSILTQVNIGLSGLHRTNAELKNESALRQTMYGAALQYVSNNLGLGLVAYQSRYSNPFVTGPLMYNQYNFVGTALANVGIHYNYTFQNIYFFGETAKSFPGGLSTVNGAMASLSRSLSIVLLNRNYAVDYHSFFARSLGETTEGSNEKGLYSGINFIPNKAWSFSIYGDVFRFPWLKYRIDGPSNGYELLGQVSFSPVKTFKATFRIKTENKQQNSDSKGDTALLKDVSKTNFRIVLNWRLNATFGFENRAEVVTYKKDAINELGYLFYQDLNYHPASEKLSGNIRLAYFHTASYNSRVYAYEDDVLYSSGFGMYNGIGLRSYINLRFKLSRKLDIWSRYAVFLYQNVETVGSGLDIIEGNKKMDIKFQLRYSF
jgi:hypothetical protein